MSTMTKWPAQKQTLRTTQKHAEQQDVTYIQNELLCVCFPYNMHFLFQINYISSFFVLLTEIVSIRFKMQIVYLL